MRRVHNHHQQQQQEGRRFMRSPTSKFSVILIVSLSLIYVLFHGHILKLHFSHLHNKEEVDVRINNSLNLFNGGSGISRKEEKKDVTHDGEDRPKERQRDLESTITVADDDPKETKHNNNMSKVIPPAAPPQNEQQQNSQHQNNQNQQQSKKEKKLNIVLLYADDWRYDSIGYLDPYIHTPALNQLTKEGLTFTQNAVTTSICWISRACLATGQHYARHKTIDLSDPVPFHQHWNDTLFAKLKDNGYYTGMVGKWQPGAIKNYMFDFSNSYFGFHYSKQEGMHITDMNERDALQFLQTERRKLKNKDKPFALFVNFFAPHHHDGHPEQYVPQNKTKHLYRDKNVTFGPTCTEEAWNNMPSFFTEGNEGRIRWRQRFDGDALAQKMIKNYYRLISGVDMTCGKIIEELQAQNLMDDTLIIFTTDNGYYLGEHGLADKFYANQESIRVPLVIKDPRMDEDLIGTQNEELTLSIDLAPTILQAAGIDVPERMQGSDMSVLYRRREKQQQRKDTTMSEQQQWRRSFYYEYPGMPDNAAHLPIQALVQKDFKYMYWPQHEYEELYHLPSDPYEEHNLFHNVSYQVTLQEMRQRFKEAQADAQ